jgi:beta-glucosidase
VVVNSGAPVILPWRDEVAAILLAWFGGQEMGNALADVLLGNAEPGGRLPTTWPAAADDVPVYETTPTDGRLDYTEGIHLGYRAWLRAGTSPAWPFGHGLGYTTWEYLDVDVDHDADGGATVQVSLRNVGQRAGKEVVQVYLSRPATAVDRPARWLAGFAAVTAAPGQTTSVRVPLPTRAFQHWSVDQHDWATEPGTFDISVGASVQDLRLHTQVSPSSTRRSNSK